MAAGNQERRDLLRQLEARRAALSHAALEGTRARVGQPVQWPAPPRGDEDGTDAAQASRITIRETADGLGIHMPAVKNVPIILFLLVWLAGWTAGELFALHEIFSNGFNAIDLFLVVWVSAWTFGGVMAWYFVLWQLFGIERLFVTGGGVVMEFGFGPMRRRRVWRREEVGNPHLVRSVGKQDGNSLVGRVAFEADGKVHTFGTGLTKREADEVLAAIGRHLPENGDSGAEQAP